MCVRNATIGSEKLQGTYVNNRDPRLGSQRRRRLCE